MSSSIQSRILGVGELLWDLFPAGARLGGASANFAIGCARLGHPAALITCVGDDDLGRQAIEQIKSLAQDADLDTSLIQTTSAVPTGTVAVALGPDGHPAYTIVQPVAWDRIRHMETALRAASTAAALCFGTLAQRDEPSRSAIRELVQATPAESARVFDANLRLPFYTEEAVRWSLGEATLVKISEEELERVLGALGVSSIQLRGLDTEIPELTRAGEAVLAYAPRCRLVAVTLGPRGSLLVSRTGSDYHPGFPVSVVDTVGAGDAFTSGLTHAYLSGAPLAVINRVGNLCGSYVAGQRGATPPFPPALLAEIAAALGT